MKRTMVYHIVGSHDFTVLLLDRAVGTHVQVWSKYYLLSGLLLILEK